MGKSLAASLVDNAGTLLMIPAAALIAVRI